MYREKLAFILIIAAYFAFALQLVFYVGSAIWFQFYQIQELEMHN